MLSPVPSLSPCLPAFVASCLPACLPVPVCLAGRGVPAAWRALWGDTYEADWAGHHAHKVRFIIMDSSNAAAFLRSSSCPRASRWTISMDLDFFTVCNSGRDSLNEIPGR